MNFRDVELLSTYLDGQLSPSDSARIEARLSTDPDLRAVFEDLNSARSLLRKLPARKAPRNFTLTPKMVGLKPPMPRSYPVFRFATVLAALLLFFTFATNYMASTIAAAPVAYGIGGGGGCGDNCGEQPASQAPMLAAPAATQPPAATQASTESLQIQPAPTETPASAADAVRVEGTSTADTFAKNIAPVQPPSAPENQAPSTPASSFMISSTWQIVLLAVALICGAIAFALRLITIRKWRNIK